MNSPSFSLTTLLLACGGGAPATPLDCSVNPEVCDTGVGVTWTAERELTPGIPLGASVSSIDVGDLAASGTPQIYLGTGDSVTRLDGEGWAANTVIWQGGSIGYPLLADLTGDGLLDLAIDLPDSDHGAGQVVVFPGPVAGLVDWDTPHVELKGSGGPWFSYYPHGSYLSAADLNADGVEDLVVGPWVRYGPVTTDTPFDPATDTLVRATSGTVVWASSAADDLTGDGVGDLVLLGGTLFSDPCYTPQFAWGDVRIFPGPVSRGEVSVEDAPVRLAVDGVGLLPILPWAADVDGDADLDLVTVGYDLSLERVEAQLFLGPLTSEAAASSRFAIPVAVPDGVADLDGDDVPDLLVGGAALLSGPLSDLPGTETSTCAVRVDERWGAVDSPIPAYTQASWIGDLDGDGLADALLASDQELSIVLGE